VSIDVGPAASSAGAWRIRDRFGRRTIAAAVLVGLVALFGFDLLFLESSPSGEYVLAQCCGALDAEITLKDTHFDPVSRSIRADLDVQVFSVKDIAFQHLSIAVRTTGQEDSPRIPYLQTANELDHCSLIAGYDYKDPARPHKSSGSFLCTDVVIAAPVSDTEVWYPFDRYAAPLQFHACVNSTDACGAPVANPVRVVRVRAEPPRTHVIATVASAGDQAVNVTLQRRWFLRIVSVVFFVIVIVFVGYLVLATDPRDTMTKSLGIFAGLWGLRSMVVPSSISVFPTIVEGVVMTMICIVFALVLIRAVDAPEENAP
jgi:hypothetical protein